MGQIAVNSFIFGETCLNYLHVSVQFSSILYWIILTLCIYVIYFNHDTLKVHQTINYIYYFYCFHGSNVFDWFRMINGMCTKCSNALYIKWWNDFVPWNFSWIIMIFLNKQLCFLYSINTFNVVAKNWCSLVSFG